MEKEDDLLRRVRENRQGAFVFALGGDQRVLLGPVIPEDRERLRVGLTRMSNISRYLRFFTTTPTLSEEQLRYLTEVDQVNHVAWCALDPSTPSFEGLGLGRFVRLKAQPDVAETALAVIDAYQNRGLGRILLGLLYLRAREIGVRTLRGLVLPENDAVVRWFRGLGAITRPGPQFSEMDLPVYEDLTQLANTPTADRFRKTLEALSQARPRQ